MGERVEGFLVEGVLVGKRVEGVLVGGLLMGEIVEGFLVEGWWVGELVEGLLVEGLIVEGLMLVVGTFVSGFFELGVLIGFLDGFLLVCAKATCGPVITNAIAALKHMNFMIQYPLL